MVGDADNTLNHPLSDTDLDRLQATTVLYYLHETNPDNGLVRDKTDPTAPSSIAANGMALAALPIVVEHGVLFRDFAAKIARKRLRFLMELPQGPEPNASGYKGFFYHFLDIETGRRVWQCELSTINSAFLFAGALTVATYFDRDTRDEADIRTLANALYARADWNWACDGGATLTHGWRPESGFIPYRYEGYDEGLLLYILDSARQAIPCRLKVMTPIARPISGSGSTNANCCIRDHSSHTSFRTCGSTSAAFAMPLCVSGAATILRTAGRPHSSSRNMQSAIRRNSRAMANIAGASRQAMARVA